MGHLERWIWATLGSCPILRLSQVVFSLMDRGRDACGSLPKFSFIQSYQQLQRPTHQSRLWAHWPTQRPALAFVTHQGPLRVVNSEGCSKVGTWAQQERALGQLQQEKNFLHDVKEVSSTQVQRTGDCWRSHTSTSQSHYCVTSLSSQWDLWSPSCWSGRIPAADPEQSKVNRQSTPFPAPTTV